VRGLPAVLLRAADGFCFMAITVLLYPKKRKRILVWVYICLAKMYQIGKIYPDLSSMKIGGDRHHIIFALEDYAFSTQGHRSIGRSRVTRRSVRISGYGSDHPG
jgi:hypothetical protein